MSLDEHVDSLKARHAALEEAIAEEANRPQPDTVTITELKRKKLKIKDELERIAHH